MCNSHRLLDFDTVERKDRAPLGASRRIPRIGRGGRGGGGVGDIPHRRCFYVNINMNINCMRGGLGGFVRHRA